MKIRPINVLLSQSALSQSSAVMHWSSCQFHAANHKNALTTNARIVFEIRSSNVSHMKTVVLAFNAITMEIPLVPRDAQVMQFVPKLIVSSLQNKLPNAVHSTNVKVRLKCVRNVKDLIWSARRLMIAVTAHTSALGMMMVSCEFVGIKEVIVSNSIAML